MLSKIIDKLTDALGVENTQNLADMVERVKGRATERNTDQTVSIHFNHKGYVRGINGSDNVRGITPKGYTPE